jgi:hypothetical protein
VPPLPSGPGYGRVRRAEDRREGDPVETACLGKAAGKGLRADIPDTLWVLDDRRADPSASLGPEPLRHDPGRLT